MELLLKAKKNIFCVWYEGVNSNSLRMIQGIPPASTSGDVKAQAKHLGV